MSAAERALPAWYLIEGQVDGAWEPVLHMRQVSTPVSRSTWAFVADRLDAAVKTAASMTCSGPIRVRRVSLAADMEARAQGSDVVWSSSAAGGQVPT